jgi:type I restriction enzyme S subunit
MPVFQGIVADQATTMGHVKIADLKRLRVRLPPVSEQRAIAAILGTLDDKIELNRRMNRTLEAMAQALFQSWFVDFDPVRAKMVGRQPAGMDAETAALFPNQLDESLIGTLPIGWTFTSLDQIATFHNGLALQKYPAEDSEWLPVIKIAELHAGLTETTGRASPRLDPKYIVEDGDVLFSWSGSLEVVLWAGGRGALNQHLFKVTSTDYPRWFYYCWTKAHLPEFRAIAAGKATTMGHIQRHHLASAMVLVPPSALLSHMTTVVEPLFSKIVHGAVENWSLATIRDALLPMLLSGELRVSEAEKLVGSAV